MPFVFDASICAVWALTDESDALADLAMAHLAYEPATVPALWWFEIRNVLIINERRKRLSSDGSQEFLKFLGGFPIWIDNEPDEDPTFEFARKHQLSFYDAAYLEFARRKELPLATLDKALRAAAEAAGVPLLT